MTGEDGGVGVEVDGPLVLARRHAQPAADVDLDDRDDRRRAAASTASTAGTSARSNAGAGPSASQPEPAWKWTVSIVEVVARGGRDRVVEPLQPDPELGRPVARVLEVLVVAGAGTRVDPDARSAVPGARRP